MPETYIASLSRLNNTPDRLPEWYSQRIPLLSTHRVDVLFAYELQRSYPGSDIDHLLQERIQNAKIKHALYLKSLKYITECFNAEGISYALLKGCSLWEYYPESWIRQQEDIDILISPESEEKTSQLLERLGFIQEKAADRRKHIPFTNPSPEQPDLEIHFSVYPPGRGALHGGHLLELKMETSVDSIPVTVLPFSQKLLHCVIHAANHRLVTRMQWLVDIALMLEHKEVPDDFYGFRGQLKRMLKSVLWYTYKATESTAAQIAADRIYTGLFFMPLTRCAVPPAQLLENPVMKSSWRRYLYILNLVRNPLNLIRILKK